MTYVHDHNRRIWDHMATSQKRFTRPAPDSDFSQPLRSVDGPGWLGGDVKGKKLLCLAAGGGRQGPLYAAAGAEVTVVDISAEMLQLDRRVANQRRLPLKTVQTSMEDLSMFPQGLFDVVVQPVSTCYVPDIEVVYRQIGRVCAHGAIYISQHKQPTSLQTDMSDDQGYRLCEPYYRTGPLPRVQGSLHREEGTFEFLHRWSQLLGGMCRAGFAIVDVMEPMHADPTAAPGTFAHRSHYVAPYMRIKAVRTEGHNTSRSGPVFGP